MDLNSQETPKTEQQETSLTPSPISGQQPKDSLVDQSQEPKVKELAPIVSEKPVAKKKKVKEPQVIKDSPNHITIK
tara:strand:- start:606 stop:833 length:228 start_codon:yes stop_codon:yes gene_type:complete